MELWPRGYVEIEMSNFNQEVVSCDQSLASFFKLVSLNQGAGVQQTLTLCQDRKGTAQIATCRCRWRRVADSTCSLLGVMRVSNRRRWQTCRVEEAGGA